jgi:hypothetical protein
MMTRASDPPIKWRRSAALLHTSTFMTSLIEVNLPNTRAIR